MKIAMKKLLTSELKKNGWNVDDVSSYGFSRSSGGVFVMTLWKSGKTEKKTVRSMKIKIDNKREHMFLAVEMIEEMMDGHEESNDFTKRLNKEEEGWGK